MSELFHTYEEEFIKSIKEIDNKIKLISTLTNHKKQLAFTDLKSDLSQCEKYIKLMQTQISIFSSQVKMEYLRKVRQYKKDFEFTRKTLYKQQQDYALQKNKQMLIGAELEDATPQSHRQKLIRQGQKLSDTTYKLKQSVKMMHETQDIGNNIGVQLQDHTERLIQNKKKLGGIRDELHISEKSIKRMMLRIKRNKFVCFSVLGFILLIVIIILGVHFGSKSSDNSTSS